MHTYGNIPVDTSMARCTYQYMRRHALGVQVNKEEADVPACEGKAEPRRLDAFSPMRRHFLLSGEKEEDSK